MAGCKAVAKLAADCLFLPRDYVAAGVGRRNEAKAPSRKRLFPSWLELKRIPPQRDCRSGGSRTENRCMQPSQEGSTAEHFRLS